MGPRVEGLAFRARVEGVTIRLWGPGFRVEGSGFRVNGVAIRLWDSGFRG